jgi:hypothetical protein
MPSFHTTLDSCFIVPPLLRFDLWYGRQSSERAILLRPAGFEGYIVVPKYRAFLAPARRRIVAGPPPRGGA